MNRLLGIISMLTMVALAGCAVPAQQPVSKQPREIIAVPLGKNGIRDELARLPGVEPLDAAAEIGAAYPEGVLFAAGAVLPLPGGPPLLDPLARLLKDNQGASWKLVVSAKTEQGVEYDARLARKRLTVLQRYLTQRGVDGESLEAEVRTNGGASLRVILLEGAQESSSETAKE